METHLSSSMTSWRVGRLDSGFATWATTTTANEQVSPETLTQSWGHRLCGRTPRSAFSGDAGTQEADRAEAGLRAGSWDGGGLSHGNQSRCCQAAES